MEKSAKGVRTRTIYSLFLSFMAGSAGMIIAFGLDGIMGGIIGMIQWGLINGLACFLMVRKNSSCAWYVWIPCNLMILVAGIIKTGFLDSNRVKGSLLIILLSVTGAIMGLVFQNNSKNEK
jgi:hypothetical protein